MKTNFCSGERQRKRKGRKRRRGRGRGRRKGKVGGGRRKRGQRDEGEDQYPRASKENQVSLQPPAASLSGSALLEYFNDCPS